MTKLRVTWLLLVFLLAGIAGWAGAWIAAQQGLHSPVLPWASLITLSGIGILNLALGIWVFLSKRRKTKTRVAPLAAARIVVLAQAAAYGGALVSGWQAGVLLHLVPAGAGGSTVTGWGYGYAAAGLALVVIGFVVEHLCKVDEDEDDDEETETARQRRLLKGLDPAEGESGYARKTASH